MRTPRNWILLGITIGLALGVSAPAFALITSDGSGTHVAENTVEIDLSHRFPPGTNVPFLDHDSVGQLIIDRPDAPPGAFCSSAIINTSDGPAALTAAHCLADGSGKIVATSLSLMVIDVHGTQTTFTTSNPQNLFVHPNFNGILTHGYDLALVFFDQPITFFVDKYNVRSGAGGPNPINDEGRVVKLGFGEFGDGDTGGQGVDGLKRWGLNSYEKNGLGEFGVPASGGWNNLETQMTCDFDNGTLITNNLFNFYLNFVGGLILPNHSFFGGGTLGWGNDEVFADSGDSGGPNFLYDPVLDDWIIVAVTSYRFEMPNNFGGFSGNSDINVGTFSTYGEYGGDAVVTDELIDQILGLAPSAPMNRPVFPAGPVSQGDPLGPAH